MYVNNSVVVNDVTMPRSESRDPSTRRSRSRRSRSRHRVRHHHHHRPRNRLLIKYKENNFVAAVCSMVSIVIMCTALAEPKWITLSGGGCMVDDKPLNHLGTNQFFYPGKFLAKQLGFSDNTIHHVGYKFGPSERDWMDNCVTYNAVMVMKTVIAITFLAILCSLGAFILDLLGPKNRALKLLRRNAILSIVTVILTVVINLLCYWVTTEVEQLQKATKFHTGSKVVVDFDVSFYLMTAAGCLGILATACNCLRRYPMYVDSQGESLLENYDGMEPLSPPVPDLAQMGNMPAPPDLAQMDNMPPPPAYSP